MVIATDTAATRWARWHATPKDPDRPLRTIREQKQYAQQKSAEVQAARRRREEELGRERLAADRRVAAAGVALGKRYDPAKVALPVWVAALESKTAESAAAITDLSTCHKERLMKWQQLGRPWRRDEPNFKALSQYVPASFVNLAALRAVSYLLGHEPLWVRQHCYFVEGQCPISPPCAAAWRSSYDLVLAIEIRGPGEKTKEYWPPYMAGAHIYTLRTYDLLGHSMRQDPYPEGCDEIYVPSEAVPWSFVLTERLVGLEGLPCPSINRLVRRTVGAWVEDGRVLPLPWDEMYWADTADALEDLKRGEAHIATERGRYRGLKSSRQNEGNSSGRQDNKLGGTYGRQ